jgi:hypothetical protein
MERTTRVLMLVVLALGLAATLAAPALASGNNAPITLTCGGTSYDVTVGGNGTWQPARDNNSTQVFHPTAFGDVTRTFYPADGSPSETMTSPAHEFQAQQQNGHPRLDCSFLYDQTYPDGREVDTGSVSGWVA